MHGTQDKPYLHVKYNFSFWWVSDANTTQENSKSYINPILFIKIVPKACYQRAQTFIHPNIQIFKHLGVLDQT
jgi:hypothetical protein